MTEQPNILDPEWNDYVLSLFDDSELRDGKPLVAGLRRLAEKLIGEILVSRPSKVFPVQGNDLGRATVEYEVHFKTDSGIKVFSDVADSWQGNTDDAFCIFATAIACTRAEARALRKALKLRVVGADEICSKDGNKVVADLGGEDSVSKEQINLLSLKCKKLDIDAIKLVSKHSEKDIINIYESSKSEVGKAIKALTEYQNGIKIPKSLQGYKEGWNNV